MVRRVDAETGNISTVAGTPAMWGYSGDFGPATSAQLIVAGIAVDQAGNLYITDTANAVVRIVDAFGTISTIAGNRSYGFSGDGTSAIHAQLNMPIGIAADANGGVWFVDSNNHRVRKLTPAGPVVSDGTRGVVNAASYVSGGVVPGGMATLFGSNLTSAKGIHLASSLPLATELLNATVKFGNSYSAPIFAVDNVNGQEQINFQAPWELSNLVGSTVTLQVQSNGAAGTPVRVPVLAAQPGVFAYEDGGYTFAVVLHANSQLANSANPAVGGEVVMIYCTNLGAVTPSIPDGAPGTGQELTVSTPVVTIGGAIANVRFSGLAPGFVGLNQINIEVPGGLSGNQPLVVSMNESSSQPVLLPLQ